MTFKCSICGGRFDSKKPQDPERDRGFGTCSECHDLAVTHYVRFEFGNADTMRLRLSRYA